MKKKSLALLAAVVLIVGVAAGTTLAWLIDTSGPVTNTFTTSDVDVELAETPNLDLQMVPGKPITKDPKVTISATSEDCYVFVKIDKSAAYDTYLNDYKVTADWTKLDGTDNVYYRIVNDTNGLKGQDLPVLMDNKVTVKDAVTKAQMAALNADPAPVQPTLTFTAYAIQFDYLTDAGVAVTDAAGAWNLIS